MKYIIILTINKKINFLLIIFKNILKKFIKNIKKS